MSCVIKYITQLIVIVTVIEVQVIVKLYILCGFW